MKKRILPLAALLLTALLCGGCAMRTVEEMYKVPKRSEEYNNLQSAIDMAMAGLEYSAPLSGENQQTVQTADLDGDGKDEYLVFAKGTSEKPLQILIFDQDEEGKCQIAEVIESNGSAFERVEYVDIDGSPGCELVVGRQLSDQVLRSVSVYSFVDGRVGKLMSASYSKFLTCDLDENGLSELMVIQPGESEAENGVAVLFSCREGVMERSVEAGLSEPAEHIKRIMAGKLHGGTPAVYVASAVDESAIITDVFAVKDGRFTNISSANESGTGVQTLRNYYVYADDIDEDGILELPSLISVKPVAARSGAEQYLIRWYSMNLRGQAIDKLYTFHDFVGGWYLQLDSGWADRVAVEQDGSVYTFYVWDESYEQATALFTVFVLTGSDRDAQSVENNRFVLYRTEGVNYAAKLETASGMYGVTEENLINSFRLIHQDWKTGET